MTLPPPSPIEIENELAKLRAGVGSFYKWTQLDRDDEGPRSPEADLLASRLFWVVPVTPENVELHLYGAGETPAEAAAAAWVINAIWRCWWLEDGSITEAEYLAVPRRVPPGWEFDVVTSADTN